MLLQLEASKRRCSAKQRRMEPAQVIVIATVTVTVTVIVIVIVIGKCPQTLSLVIWPQCGGSAQSTPAA